MGAWFESRKLVGKHCDNHQDPAPLLGPPESFSAGVTAAWLPDWVWSAWLQKLVSRGYSSSALSLPTTWSVLRMPVRDSCSIHP